MTASNKVTMTNTPRSLLSNSFLTSHDVEVNTIRDSNISQQTVSRMGPTSRGVFSSLFSTHSDPPASSSSVSDSIPDEFRQPLTQNFGEHLPTQATLKRKRSEQEEDADTLIEDLLAGSDSDEDVKPIIIGREKKSDVQLHVRKDLFNHNALNISKQSNVTVKTPTKENSQHQQICSLSRVSDDQQNCFTLSRGSFDHVMKDMGRQRLDPQFFNPDFKNASLTKVSRTSEQGSSRSKERAILPKIDSLQSNGVSQVISSLAPSQSSWMPWNPLGSNQTFPPNVSVANYSRNINNQIPNLVEKIFDQHLYSGQSSLRPLIQNSQSLAPSGDSLDGSSDLVTPVSEHAYANNMFPSPEHAYASSTVDPQMSSELWTKPRPFNGYNGSRYRRTDGVPLYDDPTLPPGWTR